VTIADYDGKAGKEVELEFSGYTPFAINTLLERNTGSNKKATGNANLSNVMCENGKNKLPYSRLPSSHRLIKVVI
jgi:hypothetical protein